MMTAQHTYGFLALRHLIEVGVSYLVHRLTWPRRGRRLQERLDMPSVPQRHHQHFGSLDYQLLNDLGLQRSEIRAAEFGILPGDQALHHDMEAPSSDDNAVARSQPPSRA